MSIFLERLLKKNFAVRMSIFVCIIKAVNILAGNIFSKVEQYKMLPAHISMINIIKAFTQ